VRGQLGVWETHRLLLGGMPIVVVTCNSVARRREEVDRVLIQTRRWTAEDRLRLIQGLLTPEIRLRLLAEEVRGQGRPRDERRIDVVVNRAVRRVRRARAR